VAGSNPEKGASKKHWIASSLLLLAMTPKLSLRSLREAKRWDSLRSSPAYESSLCAFA
jgi:hypothetical protein